jgi:hypothetical protein
MHISKEILHTFFFFWYFVQGVYERPYGDHPAVNNPWTLLIQVGKKNLRPTIPPNSPKRWASYLGLSIPYHTQFLIYFMPHVPSHTLASFTALLQQLWDVDMEKRPETWDVLASLEAIFKELCPNYRPPDQTPTRHKKSVFSRIAGEVGALASHHCRAIHVLRRCFQEEAIRGRRSWPPRLQPPRRTRHLSESQHRVKLRAADIIILVL